MRTLAVTLALIVSTSMAQAEVDLSEVDCSKVTSAGPGVLHLNGSITLKNGSEAKMTLADEDLPKGFMSFQGKDAYALVAEKCAK